MTPCPVLLCPFPAPIAPVTPASSWPPCWPLHPPDMPHLGPQHPFPHHRASPGCSSIPSMLCSKSLSGMSRRTTLFKTATVLPVPTLHLLPQCIPHNSCLLKNELKEARSVHQASYKTKTRSHLEPRKCLWPLNIKEGIRPSLTDRPWAQYLIDTPLSSTFTSFSPVLCLP